MQNSLLDLLSSPYFLSAFLSWGVAQFSKMLAGFCRTRRFDFKYLVSTGGMPSAHSAAVCGLATSVGIHHGLGSALFALALVMAAITMFDAATVRRAAGVQARLLNEIVDELFKAHRLSERKLKELLGHTRLEVLMGLAIGILVALAVASFPAFR